MRASINNTSKLFFFAAFWVLAVPFYAQKCANPVQQWFPCTWAGGQCKYLSRIVPDAATPTSGRYAVVGKALDCGYDYR